MWTRPVPVSMATNDAATILPVRSIQGWRYSSPASAVPGNVATRGASATPAIPANASASLAATTSVSPPTRKATYSSSGWTAMARLAGSVHGVVVQITADTGPGTPSSGVSKGNFTYTDGVRCSSYSTSAWASAVLQCMHQCTGFRPLYTSPLPTKRPNSRAMTAWYGGAIV